MKTREELIAKVEKLYCEITGTPLTRAITETVVDLVVSACEDAVVGSDFTSHYCEEGDNCRDYSQGWNTARDRSLENLKKLKSK